MGIRITSIDKDKLLAKDEIEAYGLDSNKTYVIRFLYNDKLNQAADPAPFRINERFTDALAEKVIGMPWITPPNTKKHLKGKDYTFANPEELLTYQTQYSMGTFVSTLKNEKTNNYYGIVELKPEFADDAIKGRLPEFTSITLGNPKYHDDGSIIEAEFLNLQTVDYPGYAPHLASIQGVCSAGLKECVNELAVLGASGKKIDKNSFSNIINKVIGAMSEQQTIGSEPSNADIVKAVETVQAEIVEIKKMEEATQEALVEVATEAEGVDETKIKEKLGKEGSSDSSDTPAPEITGAAGKQILKTVNQLKAEYDKKFALIESENKKLQAEKRLAIATNITEKLISNKSIKAEDKEETIKYYVDKKDDSGSFVDLGLVAETLDKVPAITSEEQVIGASGFKLQTNTGNKTIGNHLLRRGNN